MANNLIEVEYNRQKAVEYAHKWAYSRNPKYYDFTGIGGDCTNFASQCIYAGAEVMNFTPTYGWYYINANSKAPAWSGVQYLYNFLTTNKGVGPYGKEVPINMVVPGDIVQLGDANKKFYHTPFIVEVNGNRLSDILVAAHTNDADFRPLNTYYNARYFRFLHIEGVRKMGRG